VVQNLTIVYLTCRKNPHFDWFFWALINQLGDHPTLKLKVVVVDHLAEERSIPDLDIYRKVFDVVHTVQKPNVWSGKHRLTKDEWWSTSSDRNTGLLLAPDGHVAFIDDLSVAMPGWLTNVVQSMHLPGVMLGAYKKVKKLVVHKGDVVSYEDYPGGRDSRWNMGDNSGAVPSNGQYLFGCSLAGPVEAFLSVGGWPEWADGMGFEDVLMGCVMQNAGIRFYYNRKMLTLESEEDHHIDAPCKKCDKGVSPKDKSHSALNIAKGSRYNHNYSGDIRAARARVLDGGTFPLCGDPQHDWYDSQPIREM